MKAALALLPPALLYLSGASMALSQGVPTTQPNLITIVREEVKLGHNAAHAAHEAGWPAAYARAKSPDTYLAMVAMTGANETWYVTSYTSHTVMGESMKRESADPVLTAELQRLARVDADHLNSLRVVHAAARPDLSHGAFPDLALARFWEITTFRVRPGHEAGFADAAKAYAASAKRASPNASWRTYEVVAGLPGPTYLVFSSVQSFGELDQVMEGGQAIMKAATPDEMAALQKFSTVGLINTETQRFRLDPGQSYVDAATKAKDPGFWAPRRRAAARP
ncbi:MAG: hypothetical protein M3373_01995 [Gemmatimonadota bacterium]|nr:hypothetical protein [Gemmatimonadota bacterium]